MLCTFHLTIRIRNVDTPKKLEKKIESFEMWTLRRMARISWVEKKTNEQVCEIIGIKTGLIQTIKERKMKFFGHTRRHASLPKLIMEGAVEGKRARGRPDRSWIDDIKDWSGTTMSVCNESAMDRQSWRAISRRPLLR